MLPLSSPLEGNCNTHNCDYDRSKAIPITRHHLKRTGMKSKYCFVRHFGKLSPGDFIYTVWVGTSTRDVVKLRLVQEYCKDTGIYFKRWDSQVDSALSLAEKPFRKSGNVTSSPFEKPSITIRQLYSMIIDDSFELFEASFVPSHFSLWLNLRNNLNFIGYQNRKKCNTSCHPYQRKNLSRRNLRDNIVTAMVGGIVLALVCLSRLFDLLCMSI